MKVLGVTTGDKDITPKEQQVKKSGDTMTGPLVAQNNTSYTVAQARNIILGTGDPPVSGVGNGDIYIKYEA